MLHERAGLIVWVNDVKQAKGLEKYGNVHYISKKMRYAVMYINADRYDDTAKNLSRLPYVKRVERSLRNELKTEYSSEVQDKTKSYSF